LNIAFVYVSIGWVPMPNEGVHVKLSKKKVALAGIASVALALTGCAGDGGSEGGGNDTRVLRMATPGAEQSVQGQSLVAWAEEVNKATDGTLTIEIYPSGSLLAGTDILPGVADGRADLGMS